ncbi:hypothetical protein LTS07_010478 [Exophiala sideris]|uniref:Extracellular mutant protein 11 C-terminal domain-containing protein n=1 Tax=Exophiala sideris TaxID=1016849 RepID=A0ABR0IYI9_9EURO|nr:hypothetical protein LTS07_010478 [Exophiala sideris]KAK5026269.1 hypothetical protein LTR13_010050 [Exophiala sideris]KAK5051058.1 hypothetical protein LTR69_010434 [Exophiala sideris]KAK5177297.1 hypothetical protein LTR44_010259 [Eurotiomycetes sp. CCFEE 6388]
MDSHNDVAKTPSATPRPRSENADINMGTAVHSSPLPLHIQTHTRTPSITRKRTNEQVYELVEQPKPSPTASRFQVSLASTITASNATSHQEEGNVFDVDRDHGSHPSREVTRSIPANTISQRDADTRSTTTISPHTSNEGFVRGIQEYQQRLEVDFQDFEHSLAERDKSADLSSIDWDELETRYNNEIQPKIDAEQEIMNEFNARFQQFMLYMQVSNDHESERAVKRLRTRVALAQNAEVSLADKQAHHAKVLQAFQSAMALLANP